MRLAFLLVAALLLAGCAASKDPATTVTETETVTLLTSEEDRGERAPSVTFSKRTNPSAAGGDLTVVAVHGDDPWNVQWSDIRIRDAAGADACTKPTGLVRAGDVVYCNKDGTHYVSHAPTNTLLYVTDF